MKLEPCSSTVLTKSASKSCKDRGLGDPIDIMDPVTRLKAVSCSTVTGRKYMLQGDNDSRG